MAKLKKAAKPELKHVQKSKIPAPIKWGAVVLILALLIPTISYFNKPKEEPKHTANLLTQYQFKKEGELNLFSAKGDSITHLDIELATNEAEQQQGLMYRTYMNDNQGMLFLFNADDERSFWMKNTYISLDMLFINSQNQIIKIHKNTTILSEQTYSSNGPAEFVLEVNAGYCDKYKIKEGDRIQFWKM